MTNDEVLDGPYLELSFRPTIATISAARRFVQSIYEPHVGDPDVASRIGLATHELLENGLKYSIDGQTLVRIRLSRAARPCRVLVETTNRISAERKEGLEEIFGEMDRASDAESFYQDAMKRARERRFGSGLGLARIWAEGEMKISRSYSDGEVHIIAATDLSEDER